AHPRDRLEVVPVQPALPVGRLRGHGDPLRAPADRAVPGRPEVAGLRSALGRDEGVATSDLLLDAARRARSRTLLGCTFPLAAADAAHQRDRSARGAEVAVLAGDETIAGRTDAPLDPGRTPPVALVT